MGESGGAAGLRPKLVVQAGSVTPVTVRTGFSGNLAAKVGWQTTALIPQPYVHAHLLRKSLGKACLNQSSGIVIGTQSFSYYYY